MSIYHYHQHVLHDIRQQFQERRWSLHELTLQHGPVLTDYLLDQFWNDDAVTGNGSGSYTFNILQAEQNLIGNWGLLKEAVAELSPDFNPLIAGPEACDVLIRLYVLNDCLTEFLDNQTTRENN